MDNSAQQILSAHKTGQSTGVYAICSANRLVLEAAMLQAKADSSILLIEATSNQVDQFGGYTGMTPAKFVAYVAEIANAMQFPAERLVLGGDHLGPNVWQGQPAEQAMENAHEQIRQYISAGFTKIHLDTSMRCADDPGDSHAPFDAGIVGERAADLCSVAEDAFAKAALRYPEPLYVIGTEVPIPGGAQEDLSEVTPTNPQDTQLTIDVTREAFLKRGLEAACERVIAVVMCSGVEFGDADMLWNMTVKAPARYPILSHHIKIWFTKHIPRIIKRNLRFGKWLKIILPF